MKYVALSLFFLLQILGHSYAGELVFLCNKINLINPIGNYGNAPDRFTVQIKLNPAGVYKHQSVVLLGPKKYFVSISATEYEYVGVSLPSDDDSVSSLIIDRSSGDSWLGFGNIKKGYGYIMYSKCRKRKY